MPSCGNALGKGFSNEKVKLILNLILGVDGGFQINERTGIQISAEIKRFYSFENPFAENDFEIALNL